MAFHQQENFRSYGNAPPPPVIAIMGGSGSGKTSFISKIISRPLPVGNSLEPCTLSVETYDYYSQNPNAHVLLADTPGFDNPERSNIEILEEFVKVIKGRPLAGIIFLQRITDNRIGGSSLRNLKLLTEICGDDFLGNVVLVTTMWDELNHRPSGEGRQRSLEADFWRPLISKGATVERCDSENAPVLILRRFLNGPFSNSGMVGIQRESVYDGKSLAETNAGRAALEGMQLEIAQAEQVIDELDEALRATRSPFEREQLERQKSKLGEKRAKMSHLIEKYTSNDSEDSQNDFQPYGEERGTENRFMAPSTMYGAESQHSYSNSLSPTITQAPKNSQAYRPKSAGVAGRSRNTNTHRPLERRSDPLYEEYPQYGNDQHHGGQYDTAQYNSEQYGSEQYGSEQYGSEQYSSEQYSSEQYNYPQQTTSPSEQQRNWGYQDNSGSAYGNTSNERLRRPYR